MSSTLSSEQLRMDQETEVAETRPLAGALDIEASSSSDRTSLTEHRHSGNKGLRHWPPQVFYIMGNEVCERFSFYGMRAVLVVYMTDQLQMGDSDAESAFHLFVGACYCLPLLGAWLSDNLFGKYKVILFLSVVYCFGHGVLAVWESKIGLLFGLILISIGTGGIKPCVAALVGDQFTQENKHLLPSMFAMFYWCINLGAASSMLAIPVVMTFSSFWAFSVPGIAMAIALAIFRCGRKQYVIVEATEKPAGFVPVSIFALQEAFRTKSCKGFWERTTCKYSRAEVDAAEAVGGLLQLFACLSMFSAIFDQQSSTWVVQAQQMDLSFLGWQIPPAQMQALNPILVMLFIPLFEVLLYPSLTALHLRLSPLRLMGAGMFLAGFSFLVVAFLQVLLDAGKKPSVLAQAPAYLVLTSSEVLVSTTGLQFAYTQAPPSSKSTIMSLWLLTVFFGNMLDAAVMKINIFSGAMMFVFFACLMFAVALVFVLAASAYRMRDYTSLKPSNATELGDGPDRSVTLLPKSDELLTLG